MGGCKASSKSRLQTLVFVVAASCASALAQSGQGALATTPPMGWNSWNSYGLTVGEEEFRANAGWMAQHLRRFGWSYAVVDEGWYLQNPEAKAGAFHFTMD